MFTVIVIVIDVCIVMSVSVCSTRRTFSTLEAIQSSCSLFSFHMISASSTSSIAKKENVEKMIEYIICVADVDADDARLYRCVNLIFLCPS